MKTIYYLAALLLLPVLWGCISEKEEADNEYSKAETSEYLWTQSELASFQQMQAINDSIASLNRESQQLNAETRGMQEVLDHVIISWADSRGFFQGFEYGRTKKNITHDALVDGCLYAVTFSALYSLMATIELSVSHSFWENLLPEDPAKGMLQLQIATAVAIKNNGYQRDQNEFIRRYTRCGNAGREPSVKLSAIHNAVVREYIKIKESGEIYPTGIINEVFSQTDLDILNDPISYRIYSNVSYLYKGATPPITAFLPPSNFYAKKVMSLYYDGLQNLRGLDDETTQNQLDALCNRYCEIIVPQESLNEVEKQHLTTAFYIAPASIILWSEEIDKDRE